MNAVRQPSDVRQLRILGGAHAGAALDLTPGRHTLGGSDDCDIALSDWTFPTLTLHVGSRGEARAQWQDTAAHDLRLDDFVPVDFGGIPVCLGPGAGEWPPEAHLLRAVRSPAPAGWEQLARRALSGDRKVMSGTIAAVAAVLMFGGFVSALSKPNEDPRAAMQASRAAVQFRLDAIVPRRLTVSVRKDGMFVDGILDTPEQRRAVLAALDGLPTPVPIGRHLTVASDVAESIRSALGLPGALVAYRGSGVFHVTVEAPDPVQAQGALDRIATDLKPVVSRIETDIRARTSSPDLPALRSTMSVDGVSLMETRDGVKHLVMIDAESATVTKTSISTAASNILTTENRP